MPAIYATAPGKVILFGEHAAVYQRPAIAAPLTQVRAKAVVQAELRGGPDGGVRIQAPDIHLDLPLDALPTRHPLAATVRLVLDHLNIQRPPALTLRVTSTIPVAAGLGSGAAVAVAMLRALSAFLGKPLGDETVCRLAFEVERLHHGTPSGVDNTVITYARPVYFVRGGALEFIQVTRPFTLVIGDTGEKCSTADMVTGVRQRWEADPETYEAHFDAIGEISRQARILIEAGHPERLGPLLDRNHALLQQIEVSSPGLDRLVQAARQTGALGAKLCGGGGGGAMLALAAPETAERVADGLKQAGAKWIILSRVE